MNDENLKKGEATRFRTGEEQARIAREGGKASGVSRSFKAALKKRLKENPEERDEIISVLFEKAFEERNLKAIDMILALGEEQETELDKKMKRAKLEKIKAETEEIRRRSDDGDGFSEEERRTLADALTAAETVWRDGDNETASNGV